MPSIHDVAGGRTDNLIDRAAQLLGAFDENHPTLSFSALIARSGLPKSTTHRISRHLISIGWLEHEDKRYTIGRRINGIVNAVTSHDRLRDVATPYLLEMYERTHLRANLGVREGMDVLYVSKIYSHRTTSRPGSADRLPLYCTGAGKVLLAFAPAGVLGLTVERGLLARTERTITSVGILGAQLARTRDTRLAVDLEECTPGVGCVSAPIVGPHGRVVAAVSLAGAPRCVLDPTNADVVRAAAQGISDTLRAGHLVRQSVGA